MSDTPATFGPKSIKRIGDAVRRVERMPQDRTVERMHFMDAGEQSFWAKIGGRSLDGKRFSWFRVRPDGDGGWVAYDPAAEGERNAVEINGHRGIPTGAVVMLHFTDYDPDGQPLYTFQYETLQDRHPLKVHDHRDNFNGGYAFAVYHPGTALPQQPWAI